MDTSVATRHLYPVSLALANIGLGITIYLGGSLLFALLLWSSAAAVLAAMVPTTDLELIDTGIVTE